MNEVKLLLNLYYETLYERLLERKGDCLRRMEQVLAGEIRERGFREIAPDKAGAYLDACAAFLEERLEMYNPTGVQYTFEPTSRKEAFELEKQLDWYDSEPEFDRLCQALRRKARLGMTQPERQAAVGEVIRQCGAYPDQSILAGYTASPTPQKLPDYVLATVLEEMLKE